MNTRILEKLGLTSSESKVYSALLSLGDATRGKLVAESKVTGSKIYDLLEKLQDKGLVSTYIQNKVMHFKSTNPHQLLNYLEKKKEATESLEKEIKSLLPSLLLSYNSSKEEQEVELLTGLHGLEIIFREQVEILKKEDICYVIGGTRGSDEEIVQAFFQKVHQMRKERGIKTKMLFNINQKESTEQLYSSKKYPETITKYIEHASPVAINVYKDRTVIIIFAKKISAISIKSQDVANSFIGYFNLLWKTAKK